MGTRTDHYVGLNAWAKQFVLAKQVVHEQGSRLYPDGRIERFDRHVEVTLAQVQVIGQTTGMSCRWFDLHQYTMPNGKVYEEFVQASPWSGGPHLFIALREVVGRNKRLVAESLWTDEELSWV